jgi:predicted dehydrogenase
VARATAERGLVVAVGYNLRSMEALPEAAERLRRNPPHVVTARWLDATPDVAWWKQRAQGGGQVVEQATHLFDLARVLAGEAEVLGAASVRRGGPDGDGDSADVADATVALLRFASGGLGTFAASRRLASASVGMELAADGELTRIARDPGGAAGFAITFEDGGDARTLPAGRDPFERQAERFLAAVVAGDPAGVPCSYADALLTDRLTRSVVAATGQPG